MKKCLNCAHDALLRTEEFLDFNGVARVSGVVYTCPNCNERYEGYSRVEELSKTVSHHIARREERLTPLELRFLRKYLGYSGRDFAVFLGVAEETVSRWESRTNPKRMKLPTEKLLRYMALVDKPISDYGLDKAGRSDDESAPLEFREEDGHWRAA